MVAKIVSVFIVVIIHAVAAVLGLGMMLLSMNGYNDKAAEAAMFAYAITQSVFVVFTAIFASLCCWFFQKKYQWEAIASVAVSVSISLLVIGFEVFLGIGIGVVSGDAVFRK